MTKITREDLMKHSSRNNSRIILASGHFDPIHIGHCEYLEKARKLGSRLIVIVNNDTQAFKKKGYVFMPQEDRVQIVRSLRCVSDAFISVDEDESVRLSITRARRKYGAIYAFAKGGDRYAREIPEAQICKDYGIRIIDGLGDKLRSSSALVDKLNEFYNST